MSQTICLFDRYYDLFTFTTCTKQQRTSSIAKWILETFTHTCTRNARTHARTHTLIQPIFSRQSIQHPLLTNKMWTRNSTHNALLMVIHTHTCKLSKLFITSALSCWLGWRLKLIYFIKSIGFVLCPQNMIKLRKITFFSQCRGTEFSSWTFISTNKVYNCISILNWLQRGVRSDLKGILPDTVTGTSEKES